MAASLGEEGLGDAQKGMHLQCLVAVSRKVSQVRRAQAGQRGAATITRHSVKSVRWLQTSCGNSPARGLEVAAPYRRGLARTSTGFWGDARETLGAASEMGTAAPMTPVAVTAWL